MYASRSRWASVIPSLAVARLAACQFVKWSTHLFISPTFTWGTCCLRMCICFLKKYRSTFKTSHWHWFMIKILNIEMLSLDGQIRRLDQWAWTTRLYILWYILVLISLKSLPFKGCWHWRCIHTPDVLRVDSDRLRWDVRFWGSPSFHRYFSFGFLGDNSEFLWNWTLSGTDRFPTQLRQYLAFYTQCFKIWVFDDRKFCGERDGKNLPFGFLFLERAPPGLHGVPSRIDDY